MNLVFDLDGTLIKAKEKQSILLKAIALRYKIDIDSEFIWQKKTSGKNNFQLLNDLGIDNSLANLICAAWQNEVENQYWLSLDSLFDDSYSTLLKIKEQNIKTSLLTARRNKYSLRIQLFNLGIYSLFDKIYCVDPEDVISQKRSILNTNDFVAFFGDTESDFESSKLTGVPFFGVSTGQRSENFLRSKGVDCIYMSIYSAVSSFFNDQRFLNNH